MESKSEGPPAYQKLHSNSEHQFHPQTNAPHSSTTVVVVPTSAGGTYFSNEPISMTCPHCGNAITTMIEEENTCLVYIICIICLLFGFVCGCCLIPFCISELKDKVHLCPRCQRQLGKKNVL